MLVMLMLLILMERIFELLSLDLLSLRQRA